MKTKTVEKHEYFDEEFGVKVVNSLCYSDLTNTYYLTQKTTNRSGQITNQIVALYPSFIKMIEKYRRDINNSSSDPICHFFNTFFYNKLDR